MANLKGCFLHQSDNWKTPIFIYWWYVKHCEYFDPCPYMCEEFDGLTIEWPKNVFCNPPYSQIDKWVDKAILEHLCNLSSHIVLLLPVRTDTRWFGKLIDYACNITFITGRLHFNESKNGAPFPSMIVELYFSSESTYCSADNLTLIKRFYEER